MSNGFLFHGDARLREIINRASTELPRPRKFLKEHTMAHAKQRGFGLARNAQQIARKAGMLLEHLHILVPFRIPTSFRQLWTMDNYGYMRWGLTMNSQVHRCSCQVFLFFHVLFRRFVSRFHTFAEDIEVRGGWHLGAEPCPSRWPSCGVIQDDPVSRWRHATWNVQRWSAMTSSPIWGSPSTAMPIRAKSWRWRMLWKVAARTVSVHP